MILIECNLSHSSHPIIITFIENVQRPEISKINKDYTAIQKQYRVKKSMNLPEK
jgi:hypothetical protein